MIQLRYRLSIITKMPLCKLFRENATPLHFSRENEHLGKTIQNPIFFQNPLPVLPELSVDFLRNDFCAPSLITLKIEIKFIYAEIKIN